METDAWEHISAPLSRVLEKAAQQMNRPRLKRDTMIANLKRQIEEQQSEISQLRRAKGLLEMENAICRRELMDWQQMTSRRNGDAR